MTPRYLTVLFYGVLPLPFTSYSWLLSKLMANFQSMHYSSMASAASFRFLTATALLKEQLPMAMSFANCVWMVCRSSGNGMPALSMLKNNGDSTASCRTHALGPQYSCPTPSFFIMWISPLCQISLYGLDTPVVQGCEYL